MMSTKTRLLLSAREHYSIEEESRRMSYPRMFWGDFDFYRYKISGQWLYSEKTNWFFNTLHQASMREVKKSIFGAIATIIDKYLGSAQDPLDFLFFEGIQEIQKNLAPDGYFCFNGINGIFVHLLLSHYKLKIDIDKTKIVFFSQEGRRRKLFLDVNGCFLLELPVSGLYFPADRFRRSYTRRFRIILQHKADDEEDKDEDDGEFVKEKFKL